MTKSPPTAAALAAVLLAASALVGCSSAASDDTAASAPAAQGPAVAPDVEAAVQEEPPAPAVPVVGDVLTPEQAQALPEGTSAYTLADGSLVAVTADQPLPAPVVADITVKADAAFQPGFENAAATLSASRSVASDASRATGKKVLVVAQVMAKAPNSTMDDAPQLLWTVAGAPIVNDPDGFTKDEAVAAAQAYVAKQADPEQFEVVVQSL